MGVLLLTFASLNGCILSTNSTVSYLEGRRPVAASLASQIRIGKTTKQWIIENLGPPTDTAAVSEGVEVLHYVATKQRKGSLDVIILGTFRESKESTETFFVSLEDGLVADFGRRKL